MMRSLAVVFSLSIVISVNAQTVLERSVNATSGTSAQSGEVHLEYTVGQIGVATAMGGDRILTQGFQQPAVNGSPEAVVSIIYPECLGVVGAQISIESITSCGNAVSISWNGATGTSDYFADEGTVLLEIETSEGCSISQEVVVEYPTDLPICDLELFNTFTPNFDNQNDYWLIGEIQQERYADNSVTIFNRWGMEVRKFTNYDNVNVVWDGTDSSGNELAQGVYYYLLEIGSETYTGFINLLK
jgi:gliding motility-associated-like protein